MKRWSEFLVPSWRTLVFCVGCGSTSALIAVEDSIREWTGADGRTLEARITWVDDITVRMERVDGEVFDIPVGRFAEADQKRIRSWEPPAIEVPAADDAVLVIETAQGRGSGFLVQEKGRVWVYTNQHVIGDAVELRALDTSGNEIVLGRLQVAGDRDLARFETSARKGLLLAEAGRTGEKVVVFGNSQGAGVITRSEGEILGVSSDAFEVSSEIVSGNSGGPVLNREGEVVGISSFVKFSEFSSDPTMADTRYEKPRRFALRLDQEIDFRPMLLEDFQSRYQVFQEEVAVFDESLGLARIILEDPTGRVMTGSIGSPEVEDIAEDHNKDVARLPQLASSGLPYKTKVRKMSGRLIDTLEDTLALAEASLESARDSIEGEPFGWMMSQIDQREETLLQWKEAVVKIEESFD